MKNQISLHLSLVSFASLATLVTATSTAWAAPASDGESPATLVAAPAARQPAAADPNIDRGFIQPTAMTQPARSLTYNNYELVLHGLTYGITDQVQTSVTVMAPLVRDMPFLGIAAVKWQFLSTPRFHLAVQGSASLIHLFTGETLAPDGTITTGSNVYTVGAGAFASYCLREDCSSLASLNATYQLGIAGRGSDNTQAIIYGGSIVHRVARHVKLLGEVTSMANTTAVADSSFSNVSGALVSYGVRLHTANIASDLGFMKPISSDGSSDPFLLGLPFINVSYRW
jgi:hypothetical protein